MFCAKVWQSLCSYEGTSTSTRDWDFVFLSSTNHRRQHEMHHHCLPCMPFRQQDLPQTKSKSLPNNQLLKCKHNLPWIKQNCHQTSWVAELTFLTYVLHSWFACQVCYVWVDTLLHLCLRWCPLAFCSCITFGVPATFGFCRLNHLNGYTNTPGAHCLFLISFKHSAFEWYQKEVEYQDSFLYWNVFVSIQVESWYVFQKWKKYSNPIGVLLKCSAFGYLEGR